MDKKLLDEIGAEFVKAKADGPVARQLRRRLEKARREYRETNRRPVENGVTPATVTTKAAVPTLAETKRMN